MALWLTRARLLTVLVLGGLVVPVSSAWAEKEDARKHYDRATAAFGLGRYADAAVEYEAAFKMRPDPALLYNCAQSYRLAGNKARAVELYRNYLRLYGESSNAEDARKHLNNLELEVAAERAVTAQSPVVSPPATVPPQPPSQPAASPPPAPSALPAPAPPSAIVLSPPQPVPTTASAADVHVNAPATPASDSPTDGEQRPLVRRPWFWVAIGVVVLGGTIAIIAASSQDKDPKATYGVIVGN